MSKSIYIEPDEEIISVVEKLGEQKEDSIFLVIPSESDLLTSLVNLKLLKKEAARLAKDITLVTQNKKMRKLIASAGLNTTEKMGEQITPGTLEAASTSKTKAEIFIEAANEDQNETADESGSLEEAAESEGVSFFTHGQKTKKLSGKVLGFKAKTVFLILIVGLIYLSLFNLLPKTSVTILAQSEPLSADFELKLDSTVNAVISQDNVVPTSIWRVNEEITEEYRATGEKKVGTKAKGVLKLVNETGRDQQISPDEIITSAQGVAYHSLISTVVPKAVVSEDGKIIFGEIEITAEALEPGTEGNLANGSRLTISTLSELRKDKIYALVASPLVGGSAETVTIVSEDDFKQAEAGLNNFLKELLEEQFKNKLSEHEILIKELTEFGEPASQASPAVGQESKKFELHTTLAAKGMVVNVKNLEQLILPIVAQRLVKNKEIVPCVRENLTLRDARSTEQFTRAEVVLHLEGQVINSFDTFEIKRRLAGKKESEARRLLLDMTGIKDVRFKSSWNITGKLPQKTSNITVEVEP